MHARDSKEANVEISIFVKLKVETEIKATPSPFPERRGELMIEKPGGLRELRVAGRVLSGSRVSERTRISIELLRMICWIQKDSYCMLFLEVNLFCFFSLKMCILIVVCAKFLILLI